MASTSLDSFLFQSTLPVWGATRCQDGGGCRREISIHAPRVGSDWPLASSRPSRGHFNPRSPCGERLHLLTIGHADEVISIHAPRVGSDSARTASSSPPGNFKPRAPCGERPAPRPWRMSSRRFQSTLPVWGATRQSVYDRWRVGISIHAPRVGSDQGDSQRHRGRVISIHAPRVGSDPAKRWLARRLRLISIHAPRVGSDQLLGPAHQQGQDFNPRSPCGERRSRPISARARYAFQSTLPVWGATKEREDSKREMQISIHAPRVGSDLAPLYHWSL